MIVEAKLDKTKVRRSFSAAAKTYDNLAELQRGVGRELLERFPLSLQAGVSLDVGCGTGFLTRLLDAGIDGHDLIALDLALPMLQVSRSKHPGIPAYYLCADAEYLPFAPHSISQIYSNLALQWVHDLPATLAGFKRVLKPAGQLVFATFGPKTLCELKAAWASVDSYTHVNEFHSVADIKDFLFAAGFKDVCADSVLYPQVYPTVLDLMRELKGIGAHNVNRGRSPKPTTRSQLQQMMVRYEDLMPENAIVASYEIIFVKAQL